MRGQRLLDEVDRLPEPLEVADRVGVGRGHLRPARFDKADIEPSARNHVGGGVLLGDADGVGARGHQGAEAEDADVLGLARQDAEDQGAGAIEAVDPGMMLVRDDVEPHLVAQPILVEAFLEQLRRGRRVAIAVGQAAAHRVDAVQHLLRDERIRVFAEIPGLHTYLGVIPGRGAAANPEPMHTVFGRVRATVRINSAWSVFMGSGLPRCARSPE